MAIEYNFTLDMDRSKRDNNIAYARTGDVDSITINADLVLNGAAYTPTGTNAFFECITPNGHSVRAAAEKTGSSVSVEVPSAAFQAAGVINVAYFRFESGEADNPTYVESTEPFAIIVREGIGDDIDAGDYIEEWRQLADQLEAIVAEVEQKAEQAETAINEQKTEVDTLKSQAQQQIAQDVVDVESAATTAKSSISTQVDGVGTAAEAAKSEINDKVAGIQSQIDTVVSDAKQEVDENIAELDKATQDAVDAMNEALSGEQVKQLKDAISRHWALDSQDMGAISSGNDLDTFTTVKSYVCKTDAIAKSLVNKPEDLACSFIMHVMSIDSSSNYLVQLIIPQTYDDTKSLVSFYIRKRVSAGTFTGWKKVGADVIAGTGVKIEDDVVSVDPDSFHQSYEDISLASSDTSITGGASIEELAVKGNTRQNLWVNPSGTRQGVTVTSNADGSLSVSGTASADATNSVIVNVGSYAIKPSTRYTFSCDKAITFGTKYGFIIDEVGSDGSVIAGRFLSQDNATTKITFTTRADMAYVRFGVSVAAGATASGTYRVMLNEGSEAEPWCPPGLNSVGELYEHEKNLWVNPSGTLRGVTVTSNEDGSVTVEGKATQRAIIALRNENLKAGSIYTVSSDNKMSDSWTTGQANSGAGFAVIFRSSDDSYISQVLFGYGANAAISFTVPSNASYVEFDIIVERGVTVSGTYKVMLNEGSSPSPWVAPGTKTAIQVVIAGKNLLKNFGPALPYTIRGITFSDNGDGGIKVAGTATAQAYYNFYDSSNEALLELVAGTYIARQQGSKVNMGIGVFDDSASSGFRTVVGISAANASEGETFTLDKTEKMRVFLSVDNGSTVDTVVYPQIELGSEVTEYEPPIVIKTPVNLQGNILASLPDGTRDELRIDGTGAVTAEKRTHTQTFDGSEVWWQYVNNKNYFTIASEALEKPQSNGSTEPFYCDVLPCHIASDNDVAVYFSSKIGISFTDVRAAKYVYINVPGATDMQSAKDWLSAHPVTITYATSEPETIELGSIELPSVKSDKVNVWIISGKVSEEVKFDISLNKVDYREIDALSADDVYTKQEVDKKIEDAGGMPDIVPVSRGGTGVTTAAAERNRLGLGNTTGALPVANGGTGAANANGAFKNFHTLGIVESVASTDFVSLIDKSGWQGKAASLTSFWYTWLVPKIRSTFGFSSSNVLPVANGGTGGTSAKAAQNSLLNDMNASSDALTDSSMLVGYNASPSASNGAVHKRSVSTVWDYIAGKVADKVWEQIKAKAIRSDTTTGTDLTLVGGLESTSQTRTSTLTLGINEMSLDNSNAAPLTVNGEEVITEGNISSHLPATFDAKSVWFSTPLTQGQQKNIITEGGFTLEELRKYFVPGNLVLANMVCGGDHDVQYDVVVPMVITLGDGMVMQPTGITYNSIADAHFDCIFAVANNEQAGDGGPGLADGVAMLYSVTEVPGYANRTSTSSLKGFTVFDVVSHAI